MGAVSRSCHGDGAPAPAGRGEVATAAPSPAGTRALRVALVGNPNVGKTSLFNRLTGLNQHVGNWPGKTVERRHGRLRLDDQLVEVIDLPGVYSLGGQTVEESLTREFLVCQRPDLVVNVVDAAHLERNLYLTAQLLELGCPLVVALTMVDVAAAERREVDPARLAGALGVPVVGVVPPSGEGLEELKRALARAAGGELSPSAPAPAYDPDIEEALAAVQAALPKPPEGEDAWPTRRWRAVRLLEGDGEGEGPDGAPFAGAPAQGALRMADARYAWAQRVLERAGLAQEPPAFTAADRLDAALTHPWLGLAAAVGLLGLGVLGTFELSAPLQDGVDRLFSALGNWLAPWVAARGPRWLADLVRDGVLAGFAAVASFAPLIAGFFIFLGVLEDSGYLPRAAFVFDRWLGRFGLRGRASIGLVLGFGCNVPSVMAARAGPGETDRLLGVVLSPLVICSARLVVLSFFASAFFAPAAGAAVVAAIYLTSVVLVLTVAALFRRAMRPQGETFFFIELPPYRLPAPANVALYAWRHTWEFLYRALTVITPMVALVWALGYFPHGQVETSLLAWLGRAVEGLGRPIGLDWRMLVALFTGFLAKEGTLSTLAVLFAGEAGQGAGLAEALRASVTVPQALSFLAFFSFYSPCLATAFTIRAQTGSRRWTAFTVAYNLAVAWALGWLAYRAALWAWGSG